MIEVNKMEGLYVLFAAGFAASIFFGVMLLLQNYREKHPKVSH